MQSKKDTCARCGHRLSFSERHFNDRVSFRAKYPNSPYAGKLLCNSCFRQLWEQSPRAENIKSNESSKHDSEGEMYCPKCKQLFPSKGKMLQHYNEVHAAGLSTTPSLDKEEVNVDSIDKFESKSNNLGTSSQSFLTKTTTGYLSVFATLLLWGIFLANPVFLYISLVPLFYVVAGLFLDQPKEIQLNRLEMKSSCLVGETISVATDVAIEEGFGFLVLHDFIPKHFELVEGSNFKIIWKGLKLKKDTFSFKVRCTKRGIYSFNKMDWEFRHALGLRQTVLGHFNQEKVLSVQLRTVPLRRIRNTKVLSRLPLPLGAISNSGISTTDFKEIRNYSSGDPYKSINWKVTARMSSREFTKPFVNEFEKEGKKFVWIFVDGSSSMGSHGTVISNAFEHAIAAANDLSQYYLERNCFVGVYLYNKRHRMVYPDIGRRQKFKILQELLSMEMGKDEPLRESVQRCRSHLIGNSPLSIIITALSESKTNDLVEGIKELKKYNRTYVKSSILLINVKSYAFAVNTEEEMLSANILQCKDFPIENKLREAGTLVVNWNPVEQPLARVLLSEVKRR